MAKQTDIASFVIRPASGAHCTRHASLFLSQSGVSVAYSLHVSNLMVTDDFDCAYIIYTLAVPVDRLIVAVDGTQSCTRVALIHDWPLTSSNGIEQCKLKCFSQLLSSKIYTPFSVGVCQWGV